MQGYTPSDVQAGDSATIKGRAASYNQNSAIQTARAIYTNEGWRAFYRGKIVPTHRLYAR